MNWYYIEAGQQVGPITDTDLEAQVKAGKVTSTTMVWHEGLADWQPYNVAQARQKVGTPSGSPAAGGATSCTECGRAFSTNDMIRYGELWVCAACKPIFVQKLKEGVGVIGAMEYAGFGIRFAAKLIDGVILGVTGMVLTFLPMLFLGGVNPANPRAIGTSLVMIGVMYLAQFGIAAAYGTFFVGKYGATPGKMACKLKIITPGGGNVSYAKACGRYFSEFVSTMILYIGYLMVLFDDEKRALHDRICNTRVVRTLS